MVLVIVWIGGNRRMKCDEIGLTILLVCAIVFFFSSLFVIIYGCLLASSDLQL